MSQPEISEKKPKRRSRAGIVVLILFLLLVGTAGFLYYSVVKAPLELDDPQQMAASVPMSAEERFQIFPADQTAQIRMDAADLWSLILAHTGTDFLDTLNSELSSYGLNVSGCAIHMDEDGLRLDLELFYQDTRLVAKVPCALEVTGKHISLTPTAVKLGVIPLPVGSLLSKVKLDYDLSLPVISDVTQVSFTEGSLLLNGSMEQDIRNLVPLDKKLYQTAVFCEEMQPLADSLQTQAGFNALLSHLEQNPGSMEDLYRQLFVLSTPEVVEEYLDSRFGLTERFFPNIDFSAAAAEQTALSEQLASQTLVLEKFFNNVVNDYNDKKFQLSDGEFLQKKKPFQAAQYGAGKYDALFEMLDPDSFFLILVDVEDGFIRNTSSFYRICDENQQFTQSVDFNKTYILGCVLRSVDGDPFLLYETEVHQGNTYARNTTLRPLTEDDVKQLQVPGKFGIWTG